MSHVATSLPSYASIKTVRNTFSIVLVGDVILYFVNFSCCSLPSVRVHPLTFPLDFSFSKIEKERARCSSADVSDN